MIENSYRECSSKKGIKTPRGNRSVFHGNTFAGQFRARAPVRLHFQFQKTQNMNVNIERQLGWANEVANLREDYALQRISTDPLQDFSKNVSATPHAIAGSARRLLESTLHTLAQRANVEIRAATLGQKVEELVQHLMGDARFKRAVVDKFAFYSKTIKPLGDNAAHTDTFTVDNYDAEILVLAVMQFCRCSVVLLQAVAEPPPPIAAAARWPRAVQPPRETSPTTTLWIGNVPLEWNAEDLRKLLPRQVQCLGCFVMNNSKTWNISDTQYKVRLSR